MDAPVSGKMPTCQHSFSMAIRVIINPYNACDIALTIPRHAVCGRFYSGYNGCSSLYQLAKIVACTERKTMSRKLLTLVLLVLIVVVPMSTVRSAPREKGEGAVDIVAWVGYIERGDNDKNYDWVTKFEADTGCKVGVTVAATSDEMVALMNEGNFDLVTASGDASLRLVAGKRVQPVDLSRIPGYAKVDKRLQGAPWYTVDGKSYGVPYQWGPNV